MSDRLEPKHTPAQVNANDLDFLCWVNRCLFPGNFYEELQELGVEEEICLNLYMHVRFHPDKGICKIWQEFCCYENEYRQALESFIEMRKRKYEEILESEFTS